MAAVDELARALALERAAFVRHVGQMGMAQGRVLRPELMDERWIHAHARARGVELSPDAAGRLLELTLREVPVARASLAVGAPRDEPPAPFRWAGV